MNIFTLHEQIISDYRSYIESFVNIQDDEIRAEVTRALTDGRLWPEPLLQFNPAFRTVSNIEQPIQEGWLAPQLKDVFWDSRANESYRLYQHQQEALKLGSSGKSFVVTSGTGSGKSLTFIGTVFNHLFRTNSIGTGIQAVLVYPMNALINSQIEELDKYAEAYTEKTGKPFPIRYASYTGQLREEDREPLRENPPDILLTNYMMLELTLTRHREYPIRDSIYSNLRFLVFDELHTYRGRQGADVGLLVRRIRSRTQHQPVCIGTSATMVSGKESLEHQKKQIAKVAQDIFGEEFHTSQIVSEVLTKSFDDAPIPSGVILAQTLAQTIDPLADAELLKLHPTAIWLESRIALAVKESSLIRNKPKTFTEISETLASDTGVEESICRNHLTDLMQWISAANERNQNSRYTYLPFKLHQFFAQTGSVYTSLGHGSERILTLEPGVFKGHDANKIPIFPNVFSRGSGFAFICCYKGEGCDLLSPWKCWGKLRWEGFFRIEFRIWCM